MPIGGEVVMVVGEWADPEGRVAVPRSAGRLHLALMRGFELTCDGSRVSLPRSAQRLIAFLALSERAMRRSYVAGML